MKYPVPKGQRLGRFLLDGRTAVGLVEGDSVRETEARSMAKAIARGFEPADEQHDLSEVKTLSPVERPSKIICIALNYRSHIEEMKWEVPQAPIIFMKPPSSIIGTEEVIRLPSMSSRVDYEGESAIVIGSTARHAKDGLSHIFGYTCLNDVTARDLQKSDPDWTRSKGFDTFAPMGPFISGAAPRSVLTRLNGRVVQEAPLSDRVFDDAALVEYVSSVMTLEPGDVIATGTPSGIGPMKHGDLIEVEAEGIGLLRNRAEDDNTEVV